MLDAFASNGLLSIVRRNDLFLDVNERLENDGDRNMAILRKFHFQLLTEELPTSGDEGYVSFCRILRSKSNFSAIGTELCQLCSLCRSELLNETTYNEVSVSMPSVLESALSPVDHQAGRLVAKFVIDSSCKTHFKRREKTIRSSLINLGVDVVIHNGSDGSAMAESQAVAIDNASFVCSHSSISATLSLQGIDLTEIDQSGLKRSIARATGVQGDLRQVQLHSVSIPGSSLILLRLSPNSGFELLSLFSNSKRLKQFAQSLGATLHSALKRTTVQVQVSALPPFEVVVEPSGGFRCPRRRSFEITIPEFLFYVMSCVLCCVLAFCAGCFVQQRFGRHSRQSTQVRLLFGFPFDVELCIV